MRRARINAATTGHAVTPVLPNGATPRSIPKAAATSNKLTGHATGLRVVVFDDPDLRNLILLAPAVDPDTATVEPAIIPEDRRLKK